MEIDLIRKQSLQNYTIFFKDEPKLITLIDLY